jgi:hypothetical protein
LLRRGPDLLERAERDEPVAAADVDHDVAFHHAGVAEDAVTHGIEELQGLAQCLGVAAVTAVEQPLRPLITRPHRRRE